MQSQFFPSPIFGWAYVGVLTLIALVAAYVDARRLIIPKWITYPLGVLGLVANLVRGAWLGQQGRELWLFGTSNVWWGLLDGLLFALLGFLCGFTIMFLMWIMKTCGGGDVKLFGAIGAWVGPVRVLYVLAVSLPVLVVIIVLKSVFGGVAPRDASSAKQSASKRAGKKKTGKVTEAAPPKTRVSYSLPVAISLLIVLLWDFRAELRLETPDQQKRETRIHASQPS